MGTGGSNLFSQFFYLPVTHLLSADSCLFQDFFDLSLYQNPLGTADSISQRRVLVMHLNNGIHGQVDILPSSRNVPMPHDSLQADYITAVSYVIHTKRMSEAVRT